MALNKPDREGLIKEAEKRCYEWNSDRTKMINRKTNDSLIFSESGGSASTKHRRFTDLSTAKKSKAW